MGMDFRTIWTVSFPMQNGGFVASIGEVRYFWPAPIKQGALTARSLCKFKKAGIKAVPVIEVVARPQLFRH